MFHIFRHFTPSSSLHPSHLSSRPPSYPPSLSPMSPSVNFSLLLLVALPPPRALWLNEPERTPASMPISRLLAVSRCNDVRTRACVCVCVCVSDACACACACACARVPAGLGKGAEASVFQRHRRKFRQRERQHAAQVSHQGSSARLPVLRSEKERGNEIEIEGVGEGSRASERVGKGG